MKHWKHWITAGTCLLLAAALILPTDAKEAVRDAENPTENKQTEPSFQNPDGMTVDLLYYTEEADGSEKTVAKAERIIIPAGTAAVTAELQKTHLPRGYHLVNEKDIPLEEQLTEVKIQVAVSDTESQEPTEKPTEPSDKPSEPTEDPTEPSQKPEEPTEKPTEPSEKPTEPGDKPAKPTQKPTKPPVKPKPDLTNPQTRDSFPMGLWLALGLGSAGILTVIVILKKKAP